MKSVCTFALCVCVCKRAKYVLVNAGLPYPCGLKQDISIASLLSHTFSHAQEQKTDQLSHNEERNTGGGKEAVMTYHQVNKVSESVLMFSLKKTITT